MDSAMIAASGAALPTGWWRRWLAVPLVWKLVGATLLAAIVVLGVLVALGHAGALADVAVALLASLALNFVLVRLAVTPLEALQEAVERVSRGDYAHRMPPSLLEDRHTGTLRRTFNRLLDRVESDRQRHLHLARLTLEVRETERATVASQLREATAQQLSALLLQLSAAARVNRDPEVGAALNAARDIAAAIVSEIGDIAEAVYPGLLGELGLPASLHMLARRAERQDGVDTAVHIDGTIPTLPLPVVRALYRVASEAVANTVRHARASALAITLRREGDRAVLEVRDDGRGFDVSAMEQESAGVGLFGARELLAHAGGALRITSMPGDGTMIVATVPIHQTEAA